MTGFKELVRNYNNKKQVESRSKLIPVNFCVSVNLRYIYWASDVSLMLIQGKFTLRRLKYLRLAELNRNLFRMIVNKFPYGTLCNEHLKIDSTLEFLPVYSCIRSCSTYEKTALVQIILMQIATSLCGSAVLPDLQIPLAAATQREKLAL